MYICNCPGENHIAWLFTRGNSMKNVSDLWTGKMSWGEWVHRKLFLDLPGFIAPGVTSAFCFYLFSVLGVGMAFSFRAALLRPSMHG